MTQRNGTGGTSDRCLHAEASQSIRSGDRMDGVRVSDDGDCEGGQSGESRGDVMVAHAAPDGGWGWVVLVATILVLALTLAFPSCVGIFYTDLQNDFHASNSQTSWVPSIMTSVLHAGARLEAEVLKGNVAASCLAASDEEKHLVLTVELRAGEVRPPPSPACRTDEEPQEGQILLDGEELDRYKHLHQKVLQEVLTRVRTVLVEEAHHIDTEP